MDFNGEYSLEKNNSGRDGKQISFFSSTQLTLDAMFSWLTDV